MQGEGRVVNHKKIMRLMKENRLTVRPPWDEVNEIGGREVDELPRGKQPDGHRERTADQRHMCGWVEHVSERKSVAVGEHAAPAIIAGTIKFTGNEFAQ